jgi:glycosyltransferase involved in cell wall biosynthesis
MPAFYRALDCFVLPSLFEMMPIALLEAMASGLPAVVHRHPVLEWCIGAERGGEAAGVAVDMTHYGPLRDCLAELSPEWLGAHRPHARAQAVRTFSKEAVIEQYVRHYGEVAGAGRRGSQIVL